MNHRYTVAVSHFLIVAQEQDAAVPKFLRRLPFLPLWHCKGRHPTATKRASMETNHEPSQEISTKNSWKLSSFWPWKIKQKFNHITPIHAQTKQQTCSSIERLRENSSAGGSKRKRSCFRSCFFNFLPCEIIFTQFSFEEQLRCSKQRTAIELCACAYRCVLRRRIVAVT